MAVLSFEEERLEILKRYRKLLRTLKPLLKDDDAKQIKKAFLMSMEAHKDMRRKSGEPYIYHPLAVAQICVEEIGLGPTSIIAALLHDVVEDTNVTLEQIEQEFNAKIASIIDGLTKIAGTFDYGTSQQAENFRKMLLTLSDDIRVILIKLADRLHNMRTLSSMAEEKRLKIASETIYLYAPLAHRLGLNAIKTELEDLGLKYTEPEAYRDIAQKLQENKKNREHFVEHFIRPIKRSLDDRGFNYTIKGRPKSIFSIYHKIKGGNTPFEKIYDLFAVRVVLDVPLEREKAECWEVYSIVTDHYRPNPSRLKDWVSTPKSNGYESLHTTVMSMPFGDDKEGRWVEVQIRTKRMDEIAEKGVAAHFKYKGNDTRNSQAFESWLSQVREALEASDKSQSAVELVDDIKNSLYHEEVFVFTPKGKLVVLQSGATALDFAFEIHTEVGAKCIGAKVGGKLVPLSHKLGNGDQIEILTSSKQKPSEDWLRMVVTTKAKARIKEALKEENKTYVITGKDMIELRLKHFGFPNLTLELTNQLRAYFNAKDANDLFYRFGKGYLMIDQLKHWKSDKEAHERKQAEKGLKQPIVDTKSFKKQMQGLQDRKESDTLLIGEDMDKVDYTLAKCCNPISGDEVFGFVTINEGIKIHRNACPNAPELLSRHGDRVIKAQWTSKLAMSFVVHMVIRGIDRVGLINDVTRLISGELKVNITALSIGVNEGLFEGKLSLMIQDTQHLEALVAELEQVPGVIEVAREE